MTGPPVTVAVVSWNTRELLRASLEALAPEAEAGQAAVWVVDNGSSDGSPAMVAEEFAWATLLEPGENLGFGRAVNRVAAATSSPWVAAANADVALRPGALAALLQAGAQDSGAGILGPRLLQPGGSVQPSVQPFPTLTNALLAHARLYRLNPSIGRRLCLPGSWDPTAPARVDWLTGAFLLIRREAWDAIGGFDEAQWMYAEDVDVCWRAARAGWAARYVPTAVADHAHGASAAQAFGDTVDQRWIAATYAWMARRRGVGVTWALAAVNATEAALRWGLFAGLARRDPGRWAAPAAQARGQVARHRTGLRGRGALGRSR